MSDNSIPKANGEFSAPEGGLRLVGVPLAPLTDTVRRFNEAHTIGLDRGARVQTRWGEEQIFSDSEEI